MTGQQHPGLLERLPDGRHPERQAPHRQTETTRRLDVVEVGYRLGDIELRPAKVVVAGSAE